MTAKDTVSVKDFDYKVLESKTMYSTIRCHNRAGLFSSKSSDGVKISVTAPSFTNAKLSIIPRCPSLNKMQEITIKVISTMFVYNGQVLKTLPELINSRY